VVVAAAFTGGSYVRLSRLNVPQMLVFVFVFLLGIDAHAAENLPAQTIVVFNTAVLDSEALAKFLPRNVESLMIIWSDSIVHLRKKFRASNTTPRLLSRCAKFLRSGNGGTFTKRPMETSECRHLGFISSLSSGACR
jgi:hypothetical protein